MYSLTLHVCLQQLVNSRLTVNRGADWQQQQNTVIADTITGNPVIYIVGYKKKYLKNIKILKKLKYNTACT